MAGGAGAGRAGRAPARDPGKVQPMGDAMRQALFLTTVLAVWIHGCGNENVPLPGTPPIIMNFRYAPASAAENQGGGTVKIEGAFDFYDAGGDLVGLRVCSEACINDPTSCAGVAVPATGWIYGTLPYMAAVSTNCPPGEYAATAAGVDLFGLESPKIPFTFTILVP